MKSWGKSLLCKECMFHSFLRILSHFFCSHKCLKTSVQEEHRNASSRILPARDGSITLTKYFPSCQPQLTALEGFSEFLRRGIYKPFRLLKLSYRNENLITRQTVVKLPSSREEMWPWTRVTSELSDSRTLYQQAVTKEIQYIELMLVNS
jgi:hypothetical protein